MSRTLRACGAALLLMAVATVGCGDDSTRQAAESVPPGSVDESTTTSAATSASTTTPGPVVVTPTVDNGVPQHTIVIPRASLNEGTTPAQPTGCDCVSEHDGSGGIVALADGQIAILSQGATTVYTVDADGGLSKLIELPAGHYEGLVASPDGQTVLALETSIGQGVDILNGTTYPIGGIMSASTGGQTFALDDDLVLYVRYGNAKWYPVTQFVDGETSAPSDTAHLAAALVTNESMNQLAVHPLANGAQMNIDLGQHVWVGVVSQATLDDGRLVSVIATSDGSGPTTYSLLVIEGDEATLVPFDFDPTTWNVAFTMAVPMTVHGSSVTVAGFGAGVTLTTFDL
ncbi:MAG: hypothetical protein Q7V57_07395 [Actinomycetota bacterium]|nr:hypothetical protein [Actinomycetota bacterium]